MAETQTNNQLTQPNWMDEATDFEGQLAIDAYQTEDDVVIRAPLAGVLPDDLEISITDEVVTIKGQRQSQDTITQESFFAQECYWGSFTRSWLVPIGIEPDKAQASIKNGILTVRIPKLSKSRTRLIKVKSEE